MNEYLEELFTPDLRSGESTSSEDDLLSVFSSSDPPSPTNMMQTDMPVWQTEEKSNIQEDEDLEAMFDTHHRLSRSSQAMLMDPKPEPHLAHYFPAAAPPFAIDATMPSTQLKHFERRSSMPVFTQTQLKELHSLSNHANLGQPKPRHNRSHTACAGDWQQERQALFQSPLYFPNPHPPTNASQLHDAAARMGFRTLSPVDEERLIDDVDDSAMQNVHNTNPSLPPLLRRTARSTVRVACVHCHKAKAKCDNARPCSRCKRLKKSGCVDRKHIKRTRKSRVHASNNEIVYHRKTNAPGLICSSCKLTPEKCQCHSEGKPNAASTINSIPSSFPKASKDAQNDLTAAASTAINTSNQNNRPTQNGSIHPLKSTKDITMDITPIEYDAKSNNLPLAKKPKVPNLHPERMSLTNNVVFDMHGPVGSSYGIASAPLNELYDFESNPLKIELLGSPEELEIDESVSRFCNFAYQTRKIELRHTEFRARWKNKMFMKRVVEFLSRLVNGRKSKSYIDWVLNGCSSGMGCAGHSGSFPFDSSGGSSIPIKHYEINLVESPDCHLSDVPFGVVRCTRVPSNDPMRLKYKIEMNEMLCKMHGRTAEEIVASLEHTRYPVTMYHPSGWWNFFQGLLASFCGSTEDYSTINTIRRATEETIPVIQTNRYLDIRDGLPTVSLIILNPIPQHKMGRVVSGNLVEDLSDDEI